MDNPIQKLVVLVDCPKKSITALKEQASDYKVKIIDTIKSGTASEYDYITKEIETFLYSGNDILIVKFSGSELVAEDIGDEYSEMLITLSCNKNSPFYVEDLVNTFSDMIILL